MIAGSIGPYGAFLHDGSEYDGRYVDIMSKEVCVCICVLCVCVSVVLVNSKTPFSKALWLLVNYTITKLQVYYNNYN